MVVRRFRSALIFLLFTAIVPLQAGSVSRAQADVFSKKVALIQRQAEGVAGTERVNARRTALSEDELNSWFTYQASPLLPSGVTQPKVTIIGGGRVAGQATVDLDAVAKTKSSGGTLDPWSYVGGRVPVNVIGTLITRDGMGRFELQSADIGGVPVPKALLQQLVSYYSRTPADPDGVSLDDGFKLPARIRQIEVGEGQAVIVQ
jgi:hypothetical protein